MPSPDWIAVLVGGVAFFALGGLWYSPLLFARMWVPLAHPEKTVEQLRQQGGGGAGYLLAFLSGLVAVATVGFFAESLGGGPIEGFRAGAYAGIALVAACFATNYFFAGKPLRLYLIDAGYYAVGLTLAGVIYGVWPW